LFAAIARVWDFAERTCPQRFPPGVYRQRTMEAADQLRERWDEANWTRFQEARRSPKG